MFNSKLVLLNTCHILDTRSNGVLNVQSTTLFATIVCDALKL